LKIQLETGKYSLKQQLREWKYSRNGSFRLIKEILSNIEVYVFGSIIREDYDASNDVDILIVSPKTLNRIIEREEIKRSEKKIKPTHTAIHSTCT